MLMIKKCQEIMLNDFGEKKETFLAIKNRIFQSLNNCTFP